MSEQQDGFDPEEDDEEGEEALDAFYEEGASWAASAEVEAAELGALGAPDAQDDEDDEDDEGDDEDDETEEEEEDDAEDEENSSREPKTSASFAGPRFPDPPATMTVRQGDCLRSVAARYRIKPETIWDHPENAELARTRKPGTLMPGDALFIPEREKKSEKVATHRRHTFRLAPRRCEVRLTFRRGGEPRAGLAYTLEVEGEVIEGETDADGTLVARVPASATEGQLTLHGERGEERRPLRFGHLDPASEVTGVQARLNHLGYGSGAVDGDAGRITRRAILAFQRDKKLSLTGEIDGALIAALEEAHRS